MSGGPGMSGADHTPAGLVDALVAAGLLRDPRWRRAFAQVPRHLFVPRFLRDDQTLVDGGRPADRAEWLAGVYSDVALTVQTRSAGAAGPRWPTSSSTRPSLMARMLELLDAADGHRVLEIGTGTGYHAALLCHGLGDRHITSVDIDPALVSEAGDRLARLGYRPRLLARDGTGGADSGAPYHRVIATGAVRAVPPAWIDQLVGSGAIVADLRGELASSLTVLRKTAEGTVTGRFTGVPGHFMWLRPSAESPLPAGPGFPSTIDRDRAGRSVTSLDPATVDASGVRFLLQYLHRVEQIWASERDRVRVTHLAALDGSWAEVVAGPGSGHTAVQGGPRPLWSLVEETVGHWQRLGRPGVDRFGLTATNDGRQRLWLDTPDSKDSWPLS